MIDEFNLLARRINKANREIEGELVVQAPIIDSLEQKVDKTKVRVEKTNGKLDIYLQKNSNCCLFSLIAVEILIILILIL